MIDNLTKEETHDFSWAIQQPEGTKFTLKEYEHNGYLYFQDGFCYNEKDEIQTTIISLTKATWEIYVDKPQTLWYKQVYVNSNYVIHADDVKDFIKRVKNRLNGAQSKEIIDKILLEEAGEEMLK